MMLLGGSLSIVTTEKFEDLKEAFLFLFGLNSISQIFGTNECDRLAEYRYLISEGKNILLDGFSMTFHNDCYNEFYPASDYFENKFSKEQVVRLSKRAEEIDRMIHIKMRVKDVFELKLGLYLTLAIAALSNGIINSTAFMCFPEFNAKRNFHSPQEWNDILSQIEF